MKRIPTAFGKIAILMALSAVTLMMAALTQILIARVTGESWDMKHQWKNLLGTIGAMMVFISLAGYMIKKRWLGFPGKLMDWLKIHERLAILGVMLVFAHTGLRFKAVVPVFALVLIAVCLMSGMVGRYVYMKARRNLNIRKAKLLDAGIPSALVDDALAFETATTNTLSTWRVFHRAFTLSLILFLILHIITSLYYGG